jgi:hypothetical protein
MIQIVDRDLLWPRSITIEPPAPQVVVHVHLHLVAAVKEPPPPRLWTFS